MMNVMEDTLNDRILAYEMLALGKTEDFSLVKKNILKHGGVVLSEKPVQKIKLAYPIQKQQFCFSANFEFSMPPEGLKMLSGDLRLDDSLLRHSTYYVLAKEEKRVEKPMVRRGVASRVMRKPTDAMLTNEALEKKIEEILQ